MRGPMSHRHQFPTFACALVCRRAGHWRRTRTRPSPARRPRSMTRQKTEPVHQPSFASGGAYRFGRRQRRLGPGRRRNAERQRRRAPGAADREVRRCAVSKCSTTRCRCQGRVEYEDPLIHLTGGDGHYSTSGGASFHDAQFELLQRDAHGAAKLVDLTPAGILRLQDVTFSTCPVTEEVWQIRAGSLTLDSGQHTGVARDARVDFKGVPILYLPWLSFPLDDERKTGFLFPSVGTNSRSGLRALSALVLEHRPQRGSAAHAHLLHPPRHRHRR